MGLCRVRNLFVFAAAFMLLFGCVSSAPKQSVFPPAGPGEGPSGQMPGSDSDSHGCIGSAGYTWCEAKGKCIRTWEEECTAQLRIYTEEFPPFNYASENGSVSGRSTEILREILLRTNQSAQIQLTNWSEAYSAALAGPNTMLYSMAKNAQRENLFKWVGSIGIWDYTFYAKSDYGKTIKSLKDAKNASGICVVKKDAREQLLLSNNFTNIESVENDRTCASGVKSGSYELWLASTMSFPWMVYNAGLAKSDFTKVFTVQSADLYFAFSKDVPDSTIQLWQSKLDEIKSEGMFDRISAGYFGMGPLGGDRDSHGCISSAGYVWCEERQECIRPWETQCTSTTPDMLPGLIMPFDMGSTLPGETLPGMLPGDMLPGEMPPGMLPSETLPPETLPGAPPA